MLSLTALTLIGFGLLSIFAWRYFTIVKPDQGGSFDIALTGSPRFLNPVLAPANETDRNLDNLIFSSLMKYDGQGNLIPSAADKYAIGDNGKVYEVTLQKDILWHDGQPLTTDDIIFTIQTIQNPDYKSPLLSLWQGVEVEKVDNLTVRFRIKGAFAPFMHNLTFGILPRHLWENIPASQFALHELNLKPIGSGPYKFTKLQKDSKGAVKVITLDAFNKYFAGQTYISTLTFKFYSTESDCYAAYKKGEVKSFGFLSVKNFAELKNKPNHNLKIYSISLPRYFAVFFNQTQNKFLADKTIRQALAFATDKKTIIQEVFGGYGQEIDSPLVPGTIGYSDQIKKYDFAPEHAKNILAAAGWKDVDNDGVLEIGKNNEKLEISLTTVDWPELAQTASLLQKQWTQIGVKIDLNIKETSQAQNEIIKPRQYQALLFGEVLGIEPNFYSFWHSSQKKEAGFNLSLYENPTADKLISTALEDFDNNSRSQKYQQIVNLITEDLPAIFLFSPDFLFGAKEDVKGIDIKILDNSSSLFSQATSWYINTERVLK